MKCTICNGDMSYYFSKDFDVYGLGKVDYHKCGNCGFVASKTHYELSSEDWKRLNYEFHTDHNKRKDNPYGRNQRYLQQALMIHLMVKRGLFPGKGFLDWGSGEGEVSIRCKELFNIEVLNYDKFIRPLLNPIQEKSLHQGTFDLVINCGVFEHITSRETLDEIESYVSDTGCFAIHTLVPESVPRDPEWMYLLPVHTSFHTNRSMGVLMEQWGYKCSAYNEHSKLWVLFKKAASDIEPIVRSLNELLGWDYLKFKKGFMDYWK